MTRLARIINVDHLGELSLRLTFPTAWSELDFARVLEGRIFDSLKDQDYFAQVLVDEVSGTSRGRTVLTLTPMGSTAIMSRPTVGAARVLKEYRLPPIG